MQGKADGRTRTAYRIVVDMKRIAMVLAGLAACATPYQPEALGGGYTNTRLSRGMYSVQVNVNSYTSQGTALEYAYRRAGELCRNGFDVIDGTKTQSDFYVRYGSTVSNLPKSSVSLIVKCKTKVIEEDEGDADGDDE